MSHETGKFRGSWMFDTHDAAYYLNESWEIVWIECNKFNTKLTWVTNWKTIPWKIWNPWVYAINTQPEGIDKILEELSLTYATRIKRWIEQNEASTAKLVAA